MPVAATYPGVYIEEIPSGVRTITGVATSIAAFVGWAAKGPTDRAELLLSWPDYDRKFGGLDRRSRLGYAVSHFFANGGQRAYIVRLALTGSATAADNAVAANETLDGKLKITADNPGKWGNEYAAIIRARPAPDNDRFQLRIAKLQADGTGLTVEAFDNLSMAATDPRFVVNVLKDESVLVQGEIVGGATTPPTDTVIPATGVIPNTAKLKNGQDGKVLAPNDPDFELAAQPASGVGGVFHLDRIDLFNLLCVPGETKVTELQKLEKFCRDRRAFLIADSVATATVSSLQNGPDANITGDNAINAAFYFPWVLAPDPLQQNRPVRVSALRLCRRLVRAHGQQPRRLEGAGRHRGEPGRRQRTEDRPHRR